MNTEDKRRFQVITGSVMYLGQVTRYDIGCAVNQLARAMSKPSKAHMAAAKHLLSQVPGGDNELCNHLQARGFQANGVLRRKPGQQPRQRKIDLLLHSVSFEWPSQLQGGVARADGTIVHGGRARGCRLDNEGGSVLLLYDEGAGIRHALRQCTGVHRQHLDSSRRQQPDL